MSTMIMVLFLKTGQWVFFIMTGHNNKFKLIRNILKTIYEINEQSDVKYVENATSNIRNKLIETAFLLSLLFSIGSIKKELSIDILIDTTIPKTV